MPRPKISEEDLGKMIVPYLEDLKWDVYQEVQLHSGGRIADVVAVMGPVVWVIELKLTFGFKVLEQVYQWMPSAHYVSVGIPSRRGRCGQFERKVLKHFGIGVLMGNQFRTEEDIAPKLNRHANVAKLKESLCEEQKTYASAGSSSGSHFRHLTPFKKTCLSLERYVTQNPGISLKTLLQNIDTHYLSPTSARSSLRRYLLDGVIDTVEVVREGRKIMLYPKTSGTNETSE